MSAKIYSNRGNRFSKGQTSYVARQTCSTLLCCVPCVLAFSVRAKVPVWSKDPGDLRASLPNLKSYDCDKLGESQS